MTLNKSEIEILIENTPEEGEKRQKVQGKKKSIAEKTDQNILNKTKYLMKFLEGFKILKKDKEHTIPIASNIYQGQINRYKQANSLVSPRGIHNH
ncbi:23618_t:CDS:2 [Gigaspora margarita]|uniref:23618_t:CDS:1 n=1 Tax=Gigaspora margarita TaxID=4874 RepID=A0ABM8VVZ4_GIGMA|nr:23618_t:CDS:2 [Gigaspora margarita]